MATLPRQTQVLVVGAGPTGLAVALSLHQEGFKDIIVVDSILQAESTSRALVVHAATLDALDTIGCADEIISAGVKGDGGKVWDGYHWHELADFSVLKRYTQYPCMLFVPQAVTERVLGKRVAEVGIRVIRPFKAVAMKVNKADPEYTDVTFEDGQVIEAKYVVGADGAHSMVRTAAGISYEDPDGEDNSNAGLRQAVVADVSFTTPPPVDLHEPLFILAKGNVFLCLPLPPSFYNGERVWRVATGISMGVPPRAPPLDYIQSLVDAFGPNSIPRSALSEQNQQPMKVKKLFWSSRFRTDSAISSTHFTRLTSETGSAGGVVCIIGDAAHKHPPAGGQGMNLGLRDALALGPALAQHVQWSGGSSDRDKPLQSWATLRHKTALTVIRLVKGIMAGAACKDEVTWYYGTVPINWAKLRNWGLWLGDVTGYTKKEAPWRLSGLRNP